MALSNNQKCVKNAQCYYLYVPLEKKGKIKKKKKKQEEEENWNEIKNVKEILITLRKA